MRLCWLYKLALKYIGYCNREWGKGQHRYVNIKNLKRLTYNGGIKYYLIYGADAEWCSFSSYDILSNAIQKLGQYEDADVEKKEEEHAVSETNKTYLVGVIVKDLHNDVRTLKPGVFKNYIEAEECIKKYYRLNPAMLIAGWIEKEDIFGIRQIVYFRSFKNEYGETVPLDKAV